MVTGDSRCLLSEVPGQTDKLRLSVLLNLATIDVEVIVIS